MVFGREKQLCVVLGSFLEQHCFFLALQLQTTLTSFSVLGRLSAVVEDLQTKEQTPLFGERPKGYLILLPTGRMMALLVSEGRSPPQTDEERSKAYRSMVAYTGKYTVEGNTWTTKPDAAWNESYMRDQVRKFTLDSDKLIVETQPAFSPDFGKVVRFTVVWQKDE